MIDIVEFFFNPDYREEFCGWGNDADNKQPIIEKTAEEIKADKIQEEEDLKILVNRLLRRD